MTLASVSWLSVNTAFTILRTLIPTEPPDRKLSKIETLRLASSYIQHLTYQLIAEPMDSPCAKLQSKQWTKKDKRSSLCTFCLTNIKKQKLKTANNDYQHETQPILEEPMDLIDQNYLMYSHQ
ncbi:transcription factor 15-like isoform X2 [Cimex lectularius]|uniref:BHLH domain-containing protein n=1 Tax=Cimex lectularius TaxID=79782 RepID=A0A8I6SG07_CIMLE|nr:transcription factor 15-like isoform X2 [Cimex lectularius]